MKDKDKQQLIVTGIIPQYVGINAYMELESLQNFLRQGDLATSFMLDIEEESVFGLQEKYRETTAVAGIEQKDEQLKKMQEMMALGMTPKEVLSVITFEQWILSIGAMLTGIPLAKFMLIGISQSMSNDIFSMPTVISVESYLLAFVITIASIWVAQQAAKRKIKKLNLSDVLRASE